jgi:gliding motility-associated-like protein
MNCSASDSILITANPLPTTTFTSNVVTSNAICSGDTVQIQVSGGVFYTWNGPNNFTSFNNVIHFTPILAINTGNYTVQVTDLNGCSTSDTIALSITPDQFGSINGATSLCPKTTLVLTATGGGTYSWSGPNQFVSSNETITIPSFSAGQQGTYSVLVTDTNGCTSLNSTEVSISYSAACLDIPELVSPNGDGHNDTWQIDGLDNFLNAKVMIFNRWGNLIYEVTPYSTPWNGEPNTGLEIDGSGGKVPVGTYFYVIELNDQEKNVYKGYLELQY